MVDQQLIDCLRLKTKGKLLISPEQLPEEIGISAKQKSKIRKEGRLPIHFKNIGRLVHYSNYDVANFLLNDETSPAQEPTEEASQVKSTSAGLVSYPYAQGLCSVIGRTGNNYAELGRELEGLCQ